MNFLSEGYRSSLRILRSVALGLVALLWVHTNVQAQCIGPDNPVSFQAGDVDSCFLDGGVYTIQISAANFHNIDSINLFLDYNEANWVFDGYIILDETFNQTNSSGGETNVPLSIDDDGDMLNIHWDEKIARGSLDNSGAWVPFLEIGFRTTVTPQDLDDDLEWDASSAIYVCGGSAGQPYAEWGDDVDEVVNYYDGSLKASVAYPTIDYTVVPSQPVCANDPVEVTVTDPVGGEMEYSFNGLTFTDNPVANATAGNNTVQVRDTFGCVGPVHSIVIDAPDELDWDVDITDESCDRQGEIQFDITTPSAGPYTYWVVPSSQIMTVLNTIFLEGEDSPSLAIYRTATNQVLRPAGNYYVAVQDANGCVDLLEDYQNTQPSTWKYVTISSSSVVQATAVATVAEVSCSGGDDGEITVMNAMNGQPSPVYGYKVWLDGVVVDSIMPGMDMAVLSDLSAGDYTVEISDTVMCIWDTTITIDDVDPWTFEVGYLDAPCADATGELWVEYILDGAGDTIDIASLGDSVTFYVTGGTAMMPVDTTVLVGDTLKGIPAANYSAWIQDTITGCDPVAYDNEDGSGNTIPILDDGSITFNVVVTDETCFDSMDATVEVTDVTRSCENCNEGAYYEYMVMDTAASPAFTSEWIGIDSVLNLNTQLLGPGGYWVVVRDSTKLDSVCASYKLIDIMGADSALQMTILGTYSPTCHMGNDGYVKMYVSGGTPPYQYSVDNAPNWRDNPPFGLTEGEHILKVRDANMCIIEQIVMVDSVDAIIIDASIDSISCPGEGSPVEVMFASYGKFTDSTDYTYYYSDDSLTVFTAGTSFTPAWDSTGGTEIMPGTWYVGAEDPFGCVSNVVKVVLDPVEEMEVEVTWEDALCYGTWSGRVNLEVLSGTPDSVFMYTFANNPQVLVPENDSLLNWYPFTMDSLTESIEMQKGNYYFVVKGSCDQYSNVAFAPVGGYDAIEVDPIDSIVPVSCYDGNNGVLVVTDEVTGGAPGYGVEGAMYLYTLYNSMDEVVGEEMTETPVWDTLSAGSYMLYVYDNTDETAMPPQCPPDSVAVEILEYPELEIDDIDVYDVSCAGANNGEIHVWIEGGLGGISGLYGDDPDNATDGNSYTVTVNSITGDQGYSLKLADGIDTVVFQTQSGDFEIIVEDANGCEAIDTVTVEEPLPLTIDFLVEEPSDCGEYDGVVEGIITAGYDSAGYTVVVDGINIGDYDLGDTVLFMDTATYSQDYTIEVYPRWDKGVRPVEEPCYLDTTISIEIINPFDFDSETECTLCYGESNGTIKLTGLTGGSGAYQFQIVDETLDDYDAMDESRWWPKDAEGDNLYVSDSVVFDTMAAGAYLIYLRDDEGFTLAKCCRPHRVVVCEADSLELVAVNLVSAVECAGDSTGAIEIVGQGGTPPYMYSYTRTELGDNGYPYVGLPDPDSLTWFENDTITGLPVGTYIGWVMDANGCLTGCEINEQDLPIDDHRVVILDEGSVAVDSIAVDEPQCYGGMTDIELYGVSAGVSTTTLTFLLNGVTYEGDTVTYVFEEEAGLTDYVLDSVVAPDTSGYVLTVLTDLNCQAAGIDIWFDQPETYTVDMSVVGDGICVGEQQAVIILETVGGTAPFTFDIYADGAPYALNSPNVNHVVPIGPMYSVISTDTEGCEAVDTLDLPTPLEVTFEVANITCYADTLASAKVTAQGTPGRMFKAMWDEFEGDIVVNSGVSEWFAESIVLDQVFTYDDVNIDDVHFEITVVDDQNCTAGIDSITFDKVDGPLQVVNVEKVEGDCSSEVTFEIAGGTAPYAVYVDDVIVEDSIGFFEPITLMLSGGAHEVWVTDAHECAKVDTIELDYGVTRDTMVSVYVGDTAHFEDQEAMLDTMLTAGVYEFEYAVDTACTGLLTVTVTERPKTAPVLDTMSPMDTIADNHPLFVVTFTDDVWFDAMGYLWVFAQDSADATLQIEITADMVSGNTLTVDYDYMVSGALDLNTTYVVKVDSGVIMGDGLVWDGLMDDSWTFTTGDDWATSIDPGVETLDFKVYPNPFNNFIRIDNAEKLDRVVVSNIAGQRVLDIENPSYEIRTGNLVTGVYVVTLISNDEIVKSERIIKR